MDALHLVVFLILFPFVLSLASLSTRALAIRRAVAVPANLAVIAATLLLLSRTPQDPLFFQAEVLFIDHLLPFAEIAVGVLILYLALRSRRTIVALLAGAQLALGLVFEFLFASAALRTVQDEAQSKLPALGYTVPYALGNILLTAWGPVIVAMMA
jgi:hypothetical protein